MTRLRCPWFVIVALVAYFAAQVAARGLHHHAEELRSSCDRTTALDSSQILASSDGDDDCAHHECVICSVLFLGQTLPTSAQPAVICTCTDENSPTAP